MSLEPNPNYRKLKAARNQIFRATQIDLVLSEEGSRKLNDTISSRYRINSDQIRDLQATNPK